MQTSIQAEGFRSLREGEPVEYELDTAEDGRSKAVKVSGPDGAPPQVPSSLKIEQGLAAQACTSIPPLFPIVSGLQDGRGLQQCPTALLSHA